MVEATDSRVDALAADLGPLAQRAVPLGPLTTYGVGGPAALMVTVEEPDDLAAVRRALKGSELPTFVIGRGSNLLVSDAGFAGVVVRLGQGFNRATWPNRTDRTDRTDRIDRGDGEGPLVVRAGAALPLPVLARQAADAGWAGLTWAVGVPGSVGGAVRMNAGGHGSDMAACLVRYSWVDLIGDEEGADGVSRLAYGYRSSSVRRSEVVVEAEFAVIPGQVEVEKAALSEIVAWRRQHQPGGSNAGSVFTNPPDDSAGRLIEEAGLKGYRLGTAHVSEKHANFIQADKGGRAADVRALMEHVARVVHERSGVMLRAEVRLLGFTGEETGAMVGAGGEEQ
ncbi:MAG TPA: UDP-N-acetylmuramate dehydrogenase [Acidimicrobiales bacterium]|nr:UDP-N-acetylmuramate dehydrogenase [Acidimicrobiales bacterium]